MNDFGPEDRLVPYEGGQEEEAEEGVIDLDLSGLTEEQAFPILAVARDAGLKVRAPRRKPGQKQFRPQQRQTESVAPPPRTGARKKCGNCGGEHDTRDCKKPLLEMSKRSCFNCNGLGY